ncbi:hypothetical protein PF008_g2647 [Phytophthora fragariae]|uniref:Uncharacterized protein n=1 Tax=Phytophthora fragariae TaxID=53985 RepID=A0A6G0SGT0_9STRA|nr:hypothetical protein PF008_g2647 [Phytophthora fragariae]
MPRGYDGSTITPGRVLRDETSKPAPVYREMGRDHSSDEDFAMDQAAPDLDQLGRQPGQSPPRNKTRTQGESGAQSRPKKRKKGSLSSDTWTSFGNEAEGGLVQAAHPDTGHADAATRPEAKHTEAVAHPTVSLDTPKTPPSSNAETPTLLPAPKPGPPTQPSVVMASQARNTLD